MANENVKTVQDTSIFVDEDKNTNLHYAAARGNLDQVITEIDRGCHIDPVNFLGWTPLMMATRNGQFEVVQYLIDKRADSTAENMFGYNVLLITVASGELKVLHFILHHLLCGGVSKRSLQKFFSPVSLAVLFGYQHVVEYLIQQSFCVNAISEITVSTPLMFATAMKNTQLIQYLISNGAKDADVQKTQDSQVKHVIHKRLPQLSPLIFLTPTQIVPPLFNQSLPNSLIEMPRRCSDLQTPIFSPYVSPFPVNPPFRQQVFFPPNFSPNHFIAPTSTVTYLGHPHDFLNARLLQSSSFCSPSPYLLSPFNMAS